MGYTLSGRDTAARLLEENQESLISTSARTKQTEGSGTSQQHPPSARPLQQPIPVNLSRSTAQPKPPPGSVVAGFGISKKLSTIWTESATGVFIVQNVEFTIVQKLFECHLRFYVLNRPPLLEPYLTEEEWSALSTKMDEMGKRVRWDVYRSLVLLIVIFVMLVIGNSADEIGGSISLGDAQQSILIVLGVILAKLSFDECYENCRRRNVLWEMEEVCREYSNLMRPRGICVAFRFEDNNNHGLQTDLVFYRVQSAHDKMLDVA